MNASGVRTRAAILDAAPHIFKEKGFAAASMSDFCKACGLSRGGLYRHFQSTAAIFEAMLMRDKDDWQQSLDKGMREGAAAPELLRAYLRAVERGADDGDGRLSLAAYEYVRAEPGRAAFAKARYHTAVDMAAELLRYGIERGEFRPCDARAEAAQFVVLMDGLRISALFALEKDELAGRLEYLYHSIVKEEKV